MAEIHINISADDKIYQKAEEFLTGLGTNINTAFNDFLLHLAKNEKKPFNVKSNKTNKRLSPRADLKGFLKGKISYAEDWDAPIEGLEEYMP
jgi:antitoxin component of RelBE/YafQ-DinJ toxin-antitoxin module